MLIDLPLVCKWKQSTNYSRCNSFISCHHRPKLDDSFPKNYDYEFRKGFCIFCAKFWWIDKYQFRGGWSTRVHQAKTMGAAAVSRRFSEYLNLIYAKEISNLFQLLFEENFSVKVLLICENVCKRSHFLINFSVEICERYN